MLETQRDLGNVVGEAQDLRVWAGCIAALGEEEAAEGVLRDVIGRAEKCGRPLLAAQAERDLARLVQRIGRLEEAGELAKCARDRFNALGAEAEARRLEDIISS